MRRERDTTLASGFNNWLVVGTNRPDTSPAPGVACAPGPHQNKLAVHTNQVATAGWTYAPRGPAVGTFRSLHA